MYIKAEKLTNGHTVPPAEQQLRQPNGSSDGLTLLARRAQTNDISSINSLNFLHRPQRVAQLKTSLFPDEEIAKNTNLNKKPIAEGEFSPTAGSVADDQLAFAPVYKKSGELVKSSLKRRAKSLPSSPYVENKTLSGGGRSPPPLVRSKSVHFDQKTPVKYFCEDESPIDVSTSTDATSEEISYQHKPVRSVYDDDEFLAMRIDTLRVQPPALRSTPALRKSKRFGELLKEQRPPAPAHSVVGLYGPNFPVLSSKNPKTLKLNVFVNLSRGSKVFLQDLALNARTGDPSDRVIAGRVLVKNIFFDKRVLVKYTWDRWRSSHDVEAVYVSDGDGILPGTNMDLFQFRIEDVPEDASRAHLEFCVQYVVRNDRQRLEFWDNNDARNYRVECVLAGFHNPFT